MTMSSPTEQLVEDVAAVSFEAIGEALTSEATRGRWGEGTLGRVENRRGGRRIGEELFPGGLHTVRGPRSDPPPRAVRQRTGADGT